MSVMGSWLVHFQSSASSLTNGNCPPPPVAVGLNVALTSNPVKSGFWTHLAGSPGFQSARTIVVHIENATTDESNAQRLCRDIIPPIACNRRQLRWNDGA